MDRIRKVLIANRGEIACRIVATLRERGIRSVAVCSEADRTARHTRVADETRLIGPAEARASYLNIDAVIVAAQATGADSVHPGYGFLAENAAFAEAVEASGLVFIGPAPEQVRLMGDKRSARAVAERAGVPVVPGAESDDLEVLVRAARRIGYPVIVKAALGGGGKGMSVAGNDAELRESIETTRRLALSGFGDASVYIEKRLERARHIEVQVAGDGRGQAIHLLERECTLQRRHQKVLEECPAIGMSEALRGRITEAAVSLARAVRYRGLGTVEFLLAPGGEFYFLEMNTRLQVEHPVTEMVTGLDLVGVQLDVATGLGLPADPGIATPRVHAIEARVYAEDATRGFLPQAGDATRVRWPAAPFVRVDAGIESGDVVPVHYDPILAKIIASAPSRGAALERLAHALDEGLVHGVVTNLPFLRALVRANEVARGAFDTEWIEREFLAGFAAVATAPVPELVLAAAALAERERGGAPATDGVHSGEPTALSDPFRAAGPWRMPGLEP